MKISEQQIHNYLACVNDVNEIHNNVVPGQLVCEIVIQKLNITWSAYKINYHKTIGINELIEVSIVNDEKISVCNNKDGVKLTIVKIR